MAGMITECLLCAHPGARRTHVPKTASYRYECENCCCQYTVSAVTNAEWWHKKVTVRERIAGRVHRECAKGFTLTFRNQLAKSGCRLRPSPFDFS